MPDRIVTYGQALQLIWCLRNETVKKIIKRLESEGRSEKSICFAIWKEQNTILRYKGDPRFYSVFENCIKKWSWSRWDPRWKEYNKRKEEERKAASLQKIEEEKRAKELAYKRRYPGFIYFIQGESGGPIKIGYTENVEKRLCALQTGHYDTLKVLKAIPGNINDEKKHHKKFQHLRLRGEWFKPEQELLNYIDSLNQGR